MPHIRIDMRHGTSAGYKNAIMEGVYEALRETFDVPEDDQFMMINEHGADTFRYGRNYMGILRTDDLVMIQITVSNTRGVEKKQALFKRIVEKLAAAPGLRPEDVMVNLVEVVKENWSFGNGLAQYS